MTVMRTWSTPGLKSEGGRSRRAYMIVVVSAMGVALPVPISRLNIIESGLERKVSCMAEVMGSLGSWVDILRSM